MDKSPNQKPKRVPPGGARNRPVRVATEAAGGIALSVQEEAFAVAVAAGAGLTAALRATHPEYSTWAPASQNSKASEVGARPNVVARITQLREAAAKAGNITTGELLELHLRRIRGDVRELVTRDRRCCRHCHGAGFGYQRTTEELRADRRRHEDRQDARLAKDLPTLPDFNPEGGAGYDETRLPHAECPVCLGAGEVRTIIHDLSKLTPEALSLYGGIREGKDGTTVMINDRDPSMNAVGRHVGFFERDNQQRHAEIDYAKHADRAKQVLQQVADRQAALTAERRAMGLLGGTEDA